VDLSVWGTGRFVHRYSNRQLRPVEVMILIRHREDLSGRVLELGCGAGRIAGYLVEVAHELHGLDLSPRMVAECRRRYPGGHFQTGDMRHLSRFETGSFDAVLAGFNVLDVLGDEERRLTLREIGRVLRDYALVSDGAHGFMLVHYFITAAAQLRQLAEEGFEPVSCLDLDGRALASGESAPEVDELHYVARRA